MVLFILQLSEENLSPLRAITSGKYNISIIFINQEKKQRTVTKNKAKNIMRDKHGKEREYLKMDF